MADQPPQESFFTETEFRASLTDIRFTPQGDVKIALLVPYADRKATWAVSDAYGFTLWCRLERRRRS